MRCWIVWIHTGIEYSELDKWPMVGCGASVHESGNVEELRTIVGCGEIVWTGDQQWVGMQGWPHHAIQLLPSHLHQTNVSFHRFHSDQISEFAKSSLTISTAFSMET